MGDSRAATILLFVALAGLLGYGRYTSSVQSVQGDGFYTWMWARSLAYDFDLDLTNDYATCGDPWGMTQRGVAGGRPANIWSFGPALLWVPVAWVGRVVHPDDKGCWGPVAEMAMAASVVAALLALWLGYRLARRYVAQGPALVATLGVGVASPLPYYTIYLPSYGHAASAFAAALFLERWDATRGSRAPVRWALLGALLGLAMLMRPQNAVLALAPFGEWVVGAAATLRLRRLRPSVAWVGIGVLFAGVALVVFAPQAVLQHQMFGHPIAPPQGPNFMRWSEPHLTGVLFGSTGGLLYWTPLLYLSWLGLLAGLAWRPVRPLAAALLTVCLAMLYINAAAWDWWGSVSFSNRRFIALTAPFVVGMAIVFHGVFAWAERRPRRAAAALLLVPVAALGLWNAAAMSGVAKGDIQTWREQPGDAAWTSVAGSMASSVYDRVGNPLTWPASIPFALRYRVHPKHFDAMHGMRVFYVNYEDLAPRAGEERVEFHQPLHQAYLVEGFEVRKVRGAPAAVTEPGRARMLIPLFHGGVSGVEVTWATPAREDDRVHLGLEWNGVPVAHAALGPGKWATRRIVLPPGVPRAGINELVWQVEGAPVAIRSMEMLPAEWMPPAIGFGERARRRARE
jgi:hypothetical protein